MRSAQLMRSGVILPFEYAVRTNEQTEQCMRRKRRMKNLKPGNFGAGSSERQLSAAQSAAPNAGVKKGASTRTAWGIVMGPLLGKPGLKTSRARNARCTGLAAPLAMKHSISPAAGEGPAANIDSEY